MFDDFDDQVDTFNALFTDILDDHAPIKRVKIKARPNPFVTTEIRQLMKTRDQWHKSAIKSNDSLHGNAYRFFRQEVKRELRFAEKANVRSELLKCKSTLTLQYWSVTEIVTCILLTSNQMIFLMQFGINKHSQIFQRLQIALALRARAIFL